jgi:hypothetical protein
MEIMNHFPYYQRILLMSLHEPKCKQYVTPSLILKTTELLQKLDQIEYSMLERILISLSGININIPMI